MKKYLKYYGLFAFALFLFSNCTNHEVEKKISQVEKDFKEVPDTIQTSVYWYWISDNISKEGVIKDIEAMESVGINRAFIGNIGLGPGEPPYGKVKIFSGEWWGILHAALKRAGELGIEIGIFNSPGWSQSGGPWIKPSQSMRYLTSSKIIVEGPNKIETKLETPGEDFQDVKIIAYPAIDKLEEVISVSSSEIKSTPWLGNIKNIADGSQSTDITLPSKLTVDFKSEEAQTVRSITVYTSHSPTKARAELFVKKGNKYNSLKKFEIDRTNPSITVGFDPYGPIVISVPKTVSKSYRIIFSEVLDNSGIAEIELSSRVKVERYVEKTLAKMYQTPLPYWDIYMWEDQPEDEKANMVIDPEKIIDISSYMSKDGTLSWDVPEGKWVIERTGMLTTGVVNEPATPEATGLEVDKMSKEHVAYHFDQFLGEILRRIPAEDRKTWKVVVEDSYEKGGQNWTDGFIKEFEQTYGYSPVPFIPVLRGEVVKSREVSDRFLWDLRRIVADKVAYDYVGGLKEVSNKHGLTTWLENYGHWGFPGEFLQYGGQSDEIGGEFWSEGDLGNIENRAASSCAHIYGKSKVSAESFTCAGAPFSRYPAVMKQRGDRFFTEGINNTLLHVYIQQPYEDKNPGMNAWFGNEFNRKNTWFYDMDIFVDYLKRCNYVLQQGKYVADAAYFIGEDAPKMTGVCDPPLPKGYSFDYINGEILREESSVEDGRLKLKSGMSYRVLVLPKQETVRPELLTKILEMVKEGLVVLGPAPEKSPSLENYPQADIKVKELSKELWGGVDGKSIKYRKVGNGMIMSGMSMEEVFDMLEVIPDCKVKEEDPLLFIHRKVADGEIYFVSNQSEEAITIKPEFRVTGKVPRLWNPVTGTVRDLPEYTSKEKTTVVPLNLDALESAFIVFVNEQAVQKTTGSNYPKAQELLTIEGPWKVQFEPQFGGPRETVTFNKLIDWTSSNNDAIKYYSGKAVYITEVDVENIEEGKEIYLNIGKLTGIAKIKVNGQEVGGIWTAPWKIAITKAVKTGKNKVEISVVNNWMNRLIGDSKLPKDKRITWAPIDIYNSQSSLQSSGLIGPVIIEQVNY
ncbi:MAG: glycosyl hydrolase [Ignavibacteria bacterium]|jgi:hypothetical protein